MKKFVFVLAVVMMTAMFASAAAAADGIVVVTIKYVEQLDEGASAEYTQDDIDELARIIYWEAGGESMEGQLAVANVVLNRTRSEDFPDTIKGVISQSNQFSPYSRSDYYKKNIPDDCYTVAEMALAGDTVVGEGVLWFRSDKKPDKWYKSVYLLTIGGHHFYTI